MERITGTLLMIIFAAEFIMGIFGNGFIVLINITDWIRNWKISLIDFILTCLAISRMCYLWTTISAISFNIFSEKMVYSKNLIITFDILWTGSNLLCVACTTCLSIFYFFRIANFSNPIFLWLKWRIHKVLLIIVVGTILSFCISLILKEILNDNPIRQCIKVEKNLTVNFMELVCDFLTSQILLHLILITFFVVSLTSFLLLILSLWSHTRRMKLQGLYSRNSSTEAHIRAMKTMISFLLFFIMFYFSNMMILLAFSILRSIVAKTFAQLIVFLYPSLHPFLLILWNKKLKQSFLCVTRKLKYVTEEIIPHF